jgi:hypothetical protein
MAIVGAFETGTAFGKFSTVAVLDDGAGISYGFSQFTHRSGALCLVLERYKAIGGTVGLLVIDDRMKLVQRQTPQAIRQLSADIQFRNALRAAGITDEMKQAQTDIAFERFLRPAELECERMGFASPLALTVIHDSMVHGSWEKIRDRVLKSSPPYEAGVAATSADGVVLSPERTFITNYVESRDKWLASIPRLASTRYRTRFFLNQIKLQNWELNLPVRANGVVITQGVINKFQSYTGFQALTAKAETRPVGSVSPSINNVSGPQVSAVGSSLTINTQTPSQNSSNPSDVSPTEAQSPNAQEVEETKSEPGAVATGSSPNVSQPGSEPPAVAGGSTEDQYGVLDNLETHVNAAAAKYDQVERIATTVTTRNDAAKSLWTTVMGSVTQTFWALFGLFAGVPREVWLVVALIAAALTLMYLYRQIALGKIREGKQWRVISAE